MDFRKTPIIDSNEFEKRYSLIAEYTNFSKNRDCTIFKAFNNESMVEVFIKIPNPNGEEIEIGDYERNYNQLFYIEHQYVIKLLDVFRIEQFLNSDVNSYIPFLVFEYSEGVTLKSLFKHYFKESELRDIFQQIKEGLNYIHSQGWVHRDIKGENILVLNVNGYFQVKIIDIENMGQIGFLPKQLMGTPEFLPPEMSIKSILHPSQDYWAYGCLIYETLFGEPPFGTRNFQLEGIDIIKEYHSRINFKQLDSKISKIKNSDFKNSVINSLNPNPIIRTI